MKLAIFSCKTTYEKEISMKVFISADIEGVTGVTSWCETESGGEGYEAAARQMTLEVSAACEAAMEMGFEALVKDGHGNGRNIDMWGLPKGVELIRGWRCSPEGMMGGLDQSFDAAIYIGYHSAEGMNTNPLAHTTEHEWFNWIKIDDRLASEFSMNALYAANLGVPSVFISGDKGICDHAKEYCGDIVTVATKEGTGNSCWSMHPADSIEAIRDGVREALANLRRVSLDDREYKMDICFKEHQRARAASWYPGAELLDANSVRYRAKSVDDLMIAKMFMTEI